MKKLLFLLILDNYVFAIIVLVFSAQLNIYYLILFAVILLKFKKNIVAVIFTTISTFAVLITLNSFLVESPSKLFLKTVGFP